MNHILLKALLAGAGAGFALPLRLIDTVKLELIIDAEFLGEVLPYCAGAAGMVVCAEIIRIWKNSLWLLCAGLLGLLSGLGYSHLSDWTPPSGFRLIWDLACCVVYTLFYFSYTFFLCSLLAFLKTGAKKTRSRSQQGRKRRAEDQPAKK